MHPSVYQILGQAKDGRVKFLLLTLVLALSTGISSADGELNRERRAAGSSPLGKRINNMVAELGKRPKELYSFGIGKRSISDQEMEEFLQEEEARESQAQPGAQVKFIHNKDGMEAGKRDPYAFGLGKRGPQDAYSFGMGKRGPQDAYAFGMGKRGPQDAYAFGMGKRGPQEAYSFGMGKRDEYGFGLGKRDPYAFGLDYSGNKNEKISE
ncbi:allatostatins-like isoform X2 [Tigriopus californicus]|uniref:allatostatins-like isoform X2 n=1 Tax=Tigriopus californicus TaxID=6832 RepID=UPI0027DA20FF|nr:allatostatins-like isoform X2 [Tigriopus californicus]